MESTILVTLTHPQENGSLAVGAHQMWSGQLPAVPWLRKLLSIHMSFVASSSSGSVLVKESLLNIAQPQELKGCSVLLQEPAINCIRGVLRSKSTHPCMRILAQI